MQTQLREGYLREVLKKTLGFTRSTESGLKSNSESKQELKMVEEMLQ